MTTSHILALRGISENEVYVFDNGKAVTSDKARAQVFRTERDLKEAIINVNAWFGVRNENIEKIPVTVETILKHRILYEDKYYTPWIDNVGYDGKLLGKTIRCVTTGKILYSIVAYTDTLYSVLGSLRDGDPLQGSLEACVQHAEGSLAQQGFSPIYR